MRGGKREAQVLRYLASMPFLDRLELSAVSGMSEGTAHNVLLSLSGEGLVGLGRHASPLTASTRRFYLTKEGLGGLAREDGMSINGVLRAYPVSSHWRRILLERLDAVGVIYRLASASADVGGPIRFRWYRAMPLDAGIALSDRRTLGVIRQGPLSDGTGFSERVWRLMDAEQRLPGALLAVMPDDVRLRRASRLLTRFPGPVYLALERDVAQADSDERVWRLTSGGVALNLRSALSYVRPGGGLPSEPPTSKASIPDDLGVPERTKRTRDHPSVSLGQALLPVLLKPAEKRLLEYLSRWPFITPEDLGGLLDVSEDGVLKLVARLGRLDLVSSARIGNRRRLGLRDRGLAFLARRDRASVSTAVKRWSVKPVEGNSPDTWRNVSGRRSRHLARTIEHTEAVHGFMAMLARQVRRAGDYRIVQLAPPHEAVRYFRHGEKLRSVHPDAFGVLRKGDKIIPFFLEWERRAVRPGTMASRLAPYLRYYSSRQPLDDHGVQPLLLMVFDDPLVEARFLSVARSEMAKAGVEVPLWVSYREALEKHGPLGPAWRSPDALEPTCALT